MADYITAIRTEKGDQKIDYTALANLPSAFPPSTHNHSTDNITSGTLPVARGGLGSSTLTSGAALIGNGTGAVQTRGITNLTTKGTATASTNLATVNTLINHLQAMLNRTTSVNVEDRSDGTLESPVVTYMARGIALSPTEVEPTQSGTIVLFYE